MLVIQAINELEDQIYELREKYCDNCQEFFCEECHEMEGDD